MPEPLSYNAPNSVWDHSTMFSKQLRSQKCGVVLGGIGTGGFELWNDGRVHCWQIFNNGTWTGWTGAGFRTSNTGHFPMDGLWFALSIHAADQKQIWKLHLPDYESSRGIEEPYHVPELRFPEAIESFVRQPFGKLRYVLPGCPVEVEIEACTPMVVHDLEASAWPVAEFRMHLVNQSDAEVTAAVTGVLANEIEGYAGVWERPHEIVSSTDSMSVYFPEPSNSDAPAAGSMCLSVQGEPEELSSLPKWNANGIHHALFWRQLLSENRLGGEESKLARIMTVCQEARLAGWSEVDKDLSRLEESLRERLADMLRPFEDMRLLEHRVPILSHADHHDPKAHRDMMLEEVLRTCSQVVPPYYGAVARTTSMKPHEKKSISFRLVWRFPNLFLRNTGWGRSEKGVEDFHRTNCLDETLAGPGTVAGEETHVGHAYEKLGRTAVEISRQYATQAEELWDRSAEFTRVLYDSTLPEWLLDALNAQFTSLTTNMIYDRQGRLGLWAGCGGCGFTELGNSFFSTFLFTMLYPDASKRQIESLVRYQAKDGRMPHLLNDFESPSGYYEDDNFKFILKGYSDWIWTGDRAYFDVMYPRAVRVLEACRKLDFDGDGIPDMEGYNQDYDQWMMFGLGGYFANHWTAVLRVMSRMADYAGQEKQARCWEEEARKTAAHIEKRLWNGQWYSLYYDSHTQERNDAILANVLLGEWYSQVMGVEGSLSNQRVRSMLQMIYERNRLPGIGLKNGWLPPERNRPAGLRDWHWNVCWMGVECAVASHMIYEGMIEEGLVVARESFERHIRHGLRLNHFECGEHYIRAFTIWTVYLALQGLRWNAVEQHLRISPVISETNFRSLLLLPCAWGVLEQYLSSAPSTVKIVLREGQLTLRSLELRSPAKRIQVDGKDITFATQGTTACFATPLSLSKEKTMTIELA